jgi:very-short-patch-repair endonuclease
MDAQEKEAIKQLTELRKRILDLSKRNALLNFRHQAKSKQHLRIVDEVLSKTFNDLVAQKRFQFDPLPEPNPDMLLPKDEQTDIFQAHFREARQSDAYQKKLKKIYADTEDENDQEAAENAVNRLDRKIRDQVREILEMPPIRKAPTQSNASWAKQNGINPGYSLLYAYEATRPAHHDKNLQTLLLPDEMEAVLKSINKLSEGSLREKGVNTLYAAFGFLEWYESSDSEKSYLAPLLLLPVGLEKKITTAGTKYSVKSLGDEPSLNETLALRLEQDNVVLPEFDGDAGIEAYFKAVQEAVAKRPNWRVRPYVTIGHFSFHRVSMHQDLDPAQWPEGEKPHQHPVVKEILGGRDSDSGSNFREVYNPDHTDFNTSAPLLIRDADSSQFSAVVDVLKGENLVIQGPPGTGKSQTIANIIGAALAENKSILFVAEKQSALEVVKSRLDADGIGDYCLELHSAKATKTSVLEKVKQRIKFQPSDNSNLRNREPALQHAKEQMQSYLTTIESHIGASEITIREALWKARQKKYADMPDEMKHFSLEGTEHWTPDQRDEITDRLKSLTKAEAELSRVPLQSEWSFVRTAGLTSNDCYEIRESLEHIDTNARAIDTEGAVISELIQWQFSNELEALPSTVNAIQKLPNLEDGDLKYVYEKLTDQETFSAVKTYVEAKETLVQSEQQLRRTCNFYQTDGNSFLSLLNETLTTIKETTGETGHVKDLKQLASYLLGQNQSISNLLSTSTELLRTIGIQRTEIDKDALQTIEKLQSVTSQISETFIQSRKPILASSEALQRTNTLISEAQNHDKRLQATLEKRGLKPETPSLHRIQLYRKELENSGLFAGLRSSYRAAKKFVEGLYRTTESRPIIEMANDLATLDEALSKRDEFLSHPDTLAYLATDGTITEESMNVSKWVAETFESISRKVGSHTEIEAAFLDCIANAPENEVLQCLEQLDNLQAVPDTSPHYQSADTLNELLESHNARIKTLKQLFDTLTEKIGFQPTDEIQSLARLIPQVELHLRCAEGLIEAGAAVAKLLPDTPKNQVLRDFEDGMQVFQSVLDADLTPELISSLTTPNGSDRIHALKEHAEELQRLSDTHTRALNKLKKIIGNNGLDWARGSTDAALSKIRKLQKQDSDLDAWCNWFTEQSALKATVGAKLTELFSHQHTAEAVLDHFDYFIGKALSEVAYQQYPELRRQRGSELNDLRNKIRAIDDELKTIAKDKIVSKLEERASKAPQGTSVGSPLDWTDLSLLNRQASLQRLHWSMTTLRLIKQAGKALQQLMPCFMMSPLSVAQYIKANSLKFDLVIFDEASQVLPQDAIGALLRGKQFVIVGDGMQLPPTSFFTASGQDEDSFEEDEIQIEESILEKAQSIFYPPRRLLWHYRSKDPSLISFSNKEFYDNELHVFPGPYEVHPTMGVEYIAVDGEYVGRTNPIEADAIVNAAIQFMTEHPEKTLGLVALNAVQRDLIEEKLEYALSKNTAANRYRSLWCETLEPLFVKNLESVQGDERDAIFISTVYGPAPGQTTDSIPQRFGPINSQAGHRRLNVLFTRAKETIKIISSLRPEHIKLTERSSWGVRVLKNYLEYARSGRLETGTNTNRDPDSEFEVQVRNALRAQGYEADCQVGVGGYRIDLAVKHPLADRHYLLGVECDGAMYHSFKSARDRDRLRQNVIESLGWNIHRIWSTDWFHDQDRELTKLIRRIRELEASSTIFKNPEAPTPPPVDTEKSPSPLTPEANEEQEIDLPSLFEATKPAFSSKASEPQVELGDTVVYSLARNPDDQETVTIVDHATPPGATEFAKKDSPIGEALIGMKVGDSKFATLPSGGTTIEVHAITKNQNHKRPEEPVGTSRKSTTSWQRNTYGP